MLTSLSITSFGVLAGFGSMVLGMLMAFLSLFLIMLILLQRGRGGGLSGALGGAGGQSAFGSKAGDTFTVLTVSLAGVWIFVCAFAMWSLGMHAPRVANTIETSVGEGPGAEDSEDIASGLVIPTSESEEDAAEENDSSNNGDLIPAQEKADAGLTGPEETENAAPVEQDTATGEEPATEEPPAEASKE